MEYSSERGTIISRILIRYDKSRDAFHWIVQCTVHDTPGTFESKARGDGRCTYFNTEAQAIEDAALFIKDLRNDQNKTTV